MTGKQGKIDRFENEIAIVELVDKKMIEVNKQKFPANIAEGDKVYQTADGTWKKDVLKTREERKRIRKFMDDLFE